MPRLEKEPSLGERAANGRTTLPPLTDFTGDRNHLRWRMDALRPRVQGPEQNQWASSALMLNDAQSFGKVYGNGAEAAAFRNWVGEPFTFVTNMTTYNLGGTTGDTPRLPASVGTDTRSSEPPPDHTQVSTGGGGGGGSNAAVFQHASGSVSPRRVPSWPLLSSGQGSTTALPAAAAAAPPPPPLSRQRRRHTPAGRPWLALGGAEEGSGEVFGWGGEDQAAEDEEIVFLPPAERSLSGPMTQFLPRLRHVSV